MARIDKTEVFTFDELNDSAKERALDWARDTYFEYEWWENVFVMAKEAGAMLGIDINRIYFSGFWSQGDGACFEGAYSYRKGWRKALRSEFGGDLLAKLEAIGDDLQEIQARYFYGISASVRQSGHYMHSYCTSVNVEFEEHPTGYWNDTIEAEDGITEALRDFMDLIYRWLEEEYDWLSGEEQLTDWIIANEYQFDEDGSYWR